MENHTFTPITNRIESYCTEIPTKIELCADGKLTILKLSQNVINEMSRCAKEQGSQIGALSIHKCDQDAKILKINCHYRSGEYYTELTLNYKEPLPFINHKITDWQLRHDYA